MRIRTSIATQVSLLLIMACSNSAAVRLPELKSIAALLHRHQQQAGSGFSAGTPGQQGAMQHGWAMWDGMQLTFSGQDPGNASKHPQQSSGEC